MVKIKKQLAKLHHHIANSRKDFNHKLSRLLANNYDVIVCEDLNIQAMLKTGNSKLNLQILDQAWGQFKTFLKYKMEWQGKKLIEVNPAYTKLSVKLALVKLCGHISRKNRKSQASFKCVKCGLTLNANENASVNILRKGLKQLSSTEQTTVLAQSFKPYLKPRPLGRGSSLSFKFHKTKNQSCFLCCFFSSYFY